MALIRRLAKRAKTAGSVWPAIIASIMALPLTPTMSEMIESSLILASSSVFWIRWICEERSRTSCLRVRSGDRSSWVGRSGTKLPRIKP